MSQGIMYQGSTEAVLIGMFGPLQHDSHCAKYRTHHWLKNHPCKAQGDWANQMIKDMKEGK